MNTMNDQNTDAGGDKDALIESLREELSVLEKQVGEFNDLLCLSIMKVTGKIYVRKLKLKVLTSSDWLNEYHIGEYIHKVLWPDVKMMPTKWEREQESKEYLSAYSQCVRVPHQGTKEEYWSGVGATMVNNKLCAI
jgi:hypothetical protein